MEHNLSDLGASLNDAAVGAEFSGRTAVVDFTDCSPLSDHDSRLSLCELHLDVRDVEIAVEGLPETGEI
jgi:hypothetical protein